jgi:hypothetical protein
LPPPDTVPGAVLVDAFRDSGIEYPRVTVFAIPSEVRTSLLATGRFLTIFPMSTLRAFAERTQLKVLPVDLSASSR